MGTYLTPAQRIKLGIDIPPPKDAKKMTHEESEQQIRCVDWFRLEAYPQWADFIFAIANAGKRGKYLGYIMVKEGVLKGVMDLFITIPRNGYHGFYLEGKVEGGVLSDYQKLRIQQYRSVGYRVDVFWTFEQFQELVNDYMK